MRIQTALLTRGLLRQAMNPKPSPVTHVRLARGITSGVNTSVRQQRTAVPGASGKSELAALKERGLINNIVMRHVKSSRVTSLEIISDGKHVNITWDDGHKSRFHAMWLRHGCHCPDCRLDHNGMGNYQPDDIDLGIRVTSAEIEDNEILILKWQYSDGHTHEGPIPLAWLRSYCPSSQQERRKARVMTFFKDKTIPELEYENVMNSDHGLYEWMCHLAERGICLIKNCPQIEGTVAKIAGRIAPVQHTVYGEVFDVVSQPQPINAAYSPVSLSFHMDQCMYENAPGLQLLHCLQFDPDVIGGENTFADIFELAHQLRKERPDYFDTLVRIPVFITQIHYSRDYPIHMINERPLFSLNNRGELMSINWHPMLIEVSANEEDVEPFFEAYKHFYHMVKNFQSLYSRRLQSGDLISFNNRRVLHGRAAFSNQKGLRWFQGTYVELSEFQSRLQVFHNILGDGRPVTRLGMNNWQ
ncbi:hypothetical protein RRG08_036893 [Elysia crispata]|uniref:Gamma-butyrobetaine dioxygenase n=1 Tax=Elysia crispata TaxID=231223 RepID=A0AAE0ZCN4_9GAST|nr:hypothetical protein RRG08_036893 [Elysia crispata]